MNLNLIRLIIIQIFLEIRSMSVQTPQNLNFGGSRLINTIQSEDKQGPAGKFEYASQPHAASINVQIQSQSARDGFNFTPEQAKYHHQSVNGATQQPLQISLAQSEQRLQLQPVTLPFRKEQMVQMSGLNIYITIDATEEKVKVTVQDRRQMGMCWQAEFKSDYLEDITRKTGRAMSYIEFLTALDRSLQSQDPLSYVDLLGFNDLQLLKGQKGSKRPEDPSKPQKQYLIMTQLDRETMQKVHYPMPLVPLETSQPHLLDKETMKLMIKKMGQSLTQFNHATHSMNNTAQSHSSLGRQSEQQFGFVTARSFFSKDNPNHPQVQENDKLKKRMEMLRKLQRQGVGTPSNSEMSMRNIEAQKNQLKDEFDQFQDLSKKEIARLQRQHSEIESAISTVKVELTSEKLDSQSNLTMTSNFSMGTVDVEELRQQLAAASIELEEQKAQFKKNYSKNHKELEAHYEEIDLQTAEEKKMRVKINQLENDLEHQLKRLDIICKSKGMPKPKRPAILPDRANRGSSYVSPYRAAKGASPAGRNLSNNSGNSQKNRFGYQKSPGYTPPNARKASPGVPVSRPGGRYYSPQGGAAAANASRNRSGQNRFAGAGNNSLNNSAKFNATGGSLGSKGRSPSNNSNSGNRLYSPSGRMRQSGYGSSGQASPQQPYAARMGVNRVRREPAVGGSLNANGRSMGSAQSKSNSRTRAQDYAAKLQQQKREQRERQTRAKEAVNTSTGRGSAMKQGGSPKRNTNRDSQQRLALANQGSPYSPKKHATKPKEAAPAGNQPLQLSGYEKSSSLIGRQVEAEAASVDEKIEKLQNLLKMAKNT